MMKKKLKTTKKIRLDLTAQRAMQEAVDEVIAERKKNNLSLAVWKENRVVLLKGRQSE